MIGALARYSTLFLEKKVILTLQLAIMSLKTCKRLRHSRRVARSRTTNAHESAPRLMASSQYSPRPIRESRCQRIIFRSGTTTRGMSNKSPFQFGDDDILLL